MPDLEPIPLPPDANHYIMMPLPEYRQREEFYKRFLREIEDIDNAISRGRLEGRIEAYRAVLSHIQSPLSPIRTPEAVAKLEQLINVCQVELETLGPLSEGEERAYRLTEKAVRHVELKCPLAPGHDGPCMGEQIVGQAVGGAAPVITPSSRGA